MKNPHMRQRIAHAAARLIAEDGSLDYGSAKRKAARQLGVTEGRNLPDNLAIEEALKTYQSLYQPAQTQAVQARLREVAVEYMEKLAEHDPHLAGSVLSGTAGPHSDVNLHLYTDQEKELEFLLMRIAPGYRAEEVRSDSGGVSRPAYSIADPRATVTLTVHPVAELRGLRRTGADGQLRRARLAQLLDSGYTRDR